MNATSALAESWPYPRVVAHRGGGSLAPENTLAGFAMGARHGQRMAEFDVKLSADGVCFLLHDDELERTTDGHGPAATQRYDELARLDAGRRFGALFAGERLPTLEQAAACCYLLQLYANVEIKPCPGREAETGRQVAAQAQRCWHGHDAAGLPLLSSFSLDALAAAREAAPELPRGVLYGRIPDDWRATAARLGCVSLHADHRQFDAPLVREIRASGLRVLAYTVNDLARARELANWGVDLICTDRIDLITPATLLAP